MANDTNSHSLLPSLSEVSSTALENYHHQASEALNLVTSLQELQELRAKLLGKKSPLALAMRSLGKLDPVTRREQGQLLNQAQRLLVSLLDQYTMSIRRAEIDRQVAANAIDVTLPARGFTQNGKVHPLTQVFDEATAIFSGLGFRILEGPDIESDDLNFTKLNFPADHPARHMHDTFFMPDNEAGEKMLLRTHTSASQIRAMENFPLPIRIISPGRTYRRDSDQTHTPMFHQLEGLAIDRHSNMGNLKWLLEEFCSAFFESSDVVLRFRPSYFPFTEPSMEVDIGYSKQQGELRIGGQEEWMEILGCGMTHPNVIANCGLDPDEVQGYAWGIGLDRLAMLKYRIGDLRSFFDGNQRWIAHYGFHPLSIPQFIAHSSGD